MFLFNKFLLVRCRVCVRYKFCNLILNKLPDESEKALLNLDLNIKDSSKNYSNEVFGGPHKLEPYVSAPKPWINRKSIFFNIKVVP